MTWTFLAIIAIAIVASLAFVGVRLGLLERRLITYTPKERLAWAIAVAAIPLLGTISGGAGVYWFAVIVLGIAVYYSGPKYFQYRISRQTAQHDG